MSQFPRWPITYYDHDVVLHQDEGTPPPLAVGDGLIWADGRRYRVIDKWVSYDHHGHFDDGVHIFLEPVTTDDDRPKRIAPTYFTS
jgi:hypothetical protein